MCDFRLRTLEDDCLPQALVQARAGASHHRSYCRGSTDKPPQEMGQKVYRQAATGWPTDKPARELGQRGYRQFTIGDGAEGL